MVRTTVDEPSDQKLLDDVAEFGWHAVHVHEEGESPQFTYSIGINYSFNAPELIIVGLPSEVAHSIITIAANLAKEGTPIDTSAPSAELFENNDAYFVQVSKQAYREYVGYGLWFYEGPDFPLVQIIWPSNAGLLPWDKDAPEAYVGLQPILGSNP